MHVILAVGLDDEELGSRVINREILSVELIYINGYISLFVSSGAARPGSAGLITQDIYAPINGINSPGKLRPWLQPIDRGLPADIGFKFSGAIIGRYREFW